MEGEKLGWIQTEKVRPSIVTGRYGITIEFLTPSNFKLLFLVILLVESIIVEELELKRES